ncbi:MAG: hypothetical protein HYV09_35865 [Deltaproteobacteria bacterium]|nr:hypothetical protein [Deltaproteobacteria bacterium]
MANHCNQRRCIESSAYDQDDARRCECPCVACFAGHEEEPVAHATAPVRRRLHLSTNTGLLIAGALLGIYFVGSSAVRGCGRQPTAVPAPPTPTVPAVSDPAVTGHAYATAPAAQAAPAATPTPAAPAPEPSEPTLADDIASALPYMTDGEGGEASRGAVMLAVAMTLRLPPWSELMAVAPTDPKKVLKQSSAERGKRICVSGSLIEIHVVSSKQADIAEGGMVTDAGDTVRFAAVGSTGDLVADSYARFCGITTGRFSYETVAHETRHAVFVVGMFDMPKNHVVAAKPSAAAPAPPTVASGAKPKAKPRCHPCDPGHCPDPRDEFGCEW